MFARALSVGTRRAMASSSATSTSATPSASSSTPSASSSATPSASSASSSAAAPSSSAPSASSSAPSSAAATSSAATSSAAASATSSAAAASAAGTYSAAYVTCPSEDVAKTIARALVQMKLAACVNVIPRVTSIYSWKGNIEEDTEVLLMIKTRSSKVPHLAEYVRSAHPYDVPEVISVPIEQGNLAYLTWIGDSVPE
uniref:Protein CutA n=1 Tax=Petromyzon marinus TaxID=7757 RepID=A0AAJ7UHS3_PETMA|nr:protein CutA [Petromyzon marinus]